MQASTPSPLALLPSFDLSLPSQPNFAFGNITLDFPGFSLGTPTSPETGGSGRGAEKESTWWSDGGGSGRGGESEANWWKEEAVSPNRLPELLRPTLDQDILSGIDTLSTENTFPPSVVPTTQPSTPRSAGPQSGRFYPNTHLSEEAKRTLEMGVTLEFTRDSPLFRQTILAFEDSYSPLSGYCKDVLAALFEYDAALRALEAAQVKLASSLTGQSFSRCLFTTALPNLADMSSSLRMVSNTLNDMAKKSQEHRSALASKVCPVFEDLSGEDLKKESKMKQQMEDYCSQYEGLLDASLKRRTKGGQASNDKIVDSRRQYEMSRLDLVERLNALDCKKKLHISTSMQEMFSSIKDDLQVITPGESQAFFSTLSSQLSDAERVVEQNKLNWTIIRSKLHNEINGTLPPPTNSAGAIRLATNISRSLSSLCNLHNSFSDLI